MDNYGKLSQHLTSHHEPCFICYKPVNTDKPHARVTFSQARFAVLPNTHNHLPDFDGDWPVGKECLKNQPELEAYIA